MYIYIYVYKNIYTLSSHTRNSPLVRAEGLEKMDI